MNLIFLSSNMINNVANVSKQAMEIQYEDLEFENLLGKGEFSSVYKAIWIEEPVAVKKLKNDVIDQIDNSSDLDGMSDFSDISEHLDTNTSTNTNRW